MIPQPTSIGRACSGIPASGAARRLGRRAAGDGVVLALRGSRNRPVHAAGGKTVCRSRPASFARRSRRHRRSRERHQHADRTLVAGWPPNTADRTACSRPEFIAGKVWGRAVRGVSYQRDPRRQAGEPADTRPLSRSDHRAIGPSSRCTTTRCCYSTSPRWCDRCSAPVPSAPTANRSAPTRSSTSSTWGTSTTRATCDARKRGVDESTAVAQAVPLSTGNNLLLSENWLLGRFTTGIRSNADLAANYAGFKFYRNLTEPVRHRRPGDGSDAGSGRAVLAAQRADAAELRTSSPPSLPRIGTRP